MALLSLVGFKHGIINRSVVGFTLPGVKAYQVRDLKICFTFQAGSLVSSLQQEIGRGLREEWQKEQLD